MTEELVGWDKTLVKACVFGFSDEDCPCPMKTQCESFVERHGKAPAEYWKEAIDK